MTTTNWVFAAGSAGITGWFVRNQRAVDGADATDLLLGVSTGVLTFILLASFNWIGINTIPNLDKDKRTIPAAVFCFFAVLVFTASASSNALTLGGAVASEVHWDRLTDDAIGNFVEVRDVSTDVVALRGTLARAIQTAHSMYQAEVSGHGACRATGTGEGPCSQYFKDIGATADQAHSQLSEFSANVESMVAAGESIRTNLQHLELATSMELAERRRRLEAFLTSLDQKTRQLYSMLPDRDLRQVYDVITPAWESVGFPEDGARLAAERFSGMSGSLLSSLSEIDRIQFMAPLDFNEPTGWSALMRHSDRTFVLIILALLLDAIPLFFIAIAQLLPSEDALMWGDEVDEDEDDWEDPLGASGGRSPVAADGNPGLASVKVFDPVAHR